MDNDDRARAFGSGRRQRRKINLPAVVIEQRVAHKFYVTEIRKEVEQRIARRRNQDFIAGIAEQAKDERVCFARPGRQQEIVFVNARLLMHVVGCDCLSCLPHTARVRFIPQELLVFKCALKTRLLITKTAFGRV